MPKNINSMSPESGRIIKEDGSIINIGDILAVVYDSVNGLLKTSANLSIEGDISIGAVELKDSITGTRATVGADGLHVDIQATTSVFQGNKTLTGVADQLVTNQPCKNVTVQADPFNVGNIRLGTSAITTSAYMFILSPGSSITFTIKNVNLLYALGAIGDEVSFGGEV